MAGIGGEQAVERDDVTARARHQRRDGRAMKSRLDRAFARPVRGLSGVRPYQRAETRNARGAAVRQRGVSVSQ